MSAPTPDNNDEAWRPHATASTSEAGYRHRRHGTVPVRSRSHRGVKRRRLCRRTPTACPRGPRPPTARVSSAVGAPTKHMLGGIEHLTAAEPFVVGSPTDSVDTAADGGHCAVHAFALHRWDLRDPIRCPVARLWGTPPRMWRPQRAAWRRVTESHARHGRDAA